MPTQKLIRGLVYGPLRQINLPAVEHNIIFPIIKLFFDTTADFYVQLWRYCQVATVKELMHIAPEKDAVSDLVRATIRIWLNMSCF